jgi:hypothetical protein
MYDVQKERQSSKEAISVHSDRRNSLIQITFGQFTATKDRIKVGPRVRCQNGSGSEASSLIPFTRLGRKLNLTSYL